ncbi:hypothetical protein CDES_04220 [Corynebacterium deserti GIMN1.010]|uniref:Uncharacterized protein n=1 Tax=Corynebacterium deserti GIMN1.010 TaxID=931089 RepID=A0A0M4CF16_9CORY|nr:hypothetical protein CDES_04220 [Corynebacterium deserti GIMN1.010]
MGSVICRASVVKSSTNFGSSEFPFQNLLCGACCGSGHWVRPIDGGLICCTNAAFECWKAAFAACGGDVGWEVVVFDVVEVVDLVVVRFGAVDDGYFGDFFFAGVVQAFANGELERGGWVSFYVVSGCLCCGGRRFDCCYERLIL